MTAVKAKKTRKEDLSEMFAQADAALARKRGTASAEATEAKVELSQEERFANIETNTFFQIMFDDSLQPEEKRDAVAQELTFALEEEKEASKERLEEYALFKEYLQFERKQMAMRVIDLTDTEAFAELKSVIEELNGGVIEFDDKMFPLTEKIDAVYKLRMAGNTIGVFREIQEDKEAEAEQARLLQEYENKLENLTKAIDTHNREIASLREEKSFMRFLGGNELKKSARQEIARRQIDLQEAKAEITGVTGDITELKNANSRESQFAEFAAEKAKLRELLDITSEEHKRRQEDLVDSARNFVTSTEVRVESVLEHLEKMSGQADVLFENNGGMRNGYTILNEAEKKAGIANQDLRSNLQSGPEDEGGIAKMKRESQLESLEDFIGQLNTTSVDTTQTLKDLTEQGIGIKAMRDKNRQQIEQTRVLHSSAVSGVAERLATTLSAVSAAALNESMEGAKDSMSSMNESTRRVTMQEAIGVAANIGKTSDELDQAIEQLREFGEMQERATALTRQNLAAVKEKMTELEQETKSVADGIRESIGVHAEAELHNRSSDAPAAAKKQPTRKASGGNVTPFSRLR